jgi:sugar-specific transcriptional regulator TrmB
LRESDVIKELAQLYKQGVEPLQPTDFGGALKGRHNLYDHLAFLVKEAQQQICIITTEEGIIRKVRAIKPLLEKAKSKGVKIRIAVPHSDKNKEALEKLDGIAELKNIKDIDGRFAIVDGKHVLFMLLDDKDVHPTYDLGMWVQTPYYASAMQNLFDLAWKNKNGK